MNVPLHLFTNRLQSRQAQSSYTPISATALESNLHLSTLLDPTNPPAAAAAAAAAVVATPVHASPPSAQVENVTPSKVVHWDSDTDPENPLYFSSAKKSRIVATIAAFTFVTSLSSSSFAPAVPQVLEEFHSANETKGTISVSIFLLGYAIGALIFAPLSELYGRTPVYLANWILFVLCTIACPLSTSLNMLVTFRFLAGVTGSAPVVLGGATIGDMYPPQVRAKAMALWGLGPLLGPVLGPAVAGYLAQAQGWRAVFWMLTVAALAVLMVGILCLRETYAVVILERKTHLARLKTGDPELTSKLDSGLRTREVTLHAVVRPVKILLLSPVVTLMSIYLAFQFGVLYLLITTFPMVFKDRYHFRTGNVGLTYLGIGAGFITGLLVTGVIGDRIYQRLTARNGGAQKPEFRLPIMMATNFLIPIGLLLYGWSAQAKVYWFVPILGTSLYGLGFVAALPAVSAYIVASHPRYAASATAATTILRSIFGALLPLAGHPMYTKLGLGWGNSVLAFISVAMLPVPFLFYIYGERLRTRYPVRL